MKIPLLVPMLVCTCYMAASQTAPDFTITTTEGISRSLYADYLNQDKIVVLEFFFTTCPPCIALAPSVQQLNLQYGDGQQSVVFLELSIMPFDQNADIVAYEALHGMTYYGAGTDGGSEAAVMPYVNGDFGFFGGTPEFAVINPQGEMHFPLSGFNASQTLQNLTDAIDFELNQLTPPAAQISFENPAGLPVNLVDIYAGNDLLASNVNGNYSLSAPLPGWVITPRKEENPINGVSTLDILVISKHILGIDTFDSPCQWAASDVNLSGSVTGFDLVLLRRLILHIDTTLGIGQSWRFMYHDGANNPGCQSIPPGPGSALATPGSALHFDAVKYGDASQNANPSYLNAAENRNLPAWGLKAIPVRELTGWAWEFYAETDERWEGIQMGLSWDPRLGSYSFCSGSVLPIEPEHTGLSQIDQGKWWLSLDLPYGLPVRAGDLLFRLHFTDSTGIFLPLSLQLADDLTPEAYSDQGVHPIEIIPQVFPTIYTNRDILLSVIGKDLLYRLPSGYGSDGQWVISDAGGRVWKEAGKNSAFAMEGHIDLTDLPTGLYWFSIQINGQSPYNQSFLMY